MFARVALGRFSEPFLCLHDPRYPGANRRPYLILDCYSFLFIGCRDRALSHLHHRPLPSPEMLSVARCPSIPSIYFIWAGLPRKQSWKGRTCLCSNQGRPLEVQERRENRTSWHLCGQAAGAGTRRGISERKGDSGWIQGRGHRGAGRQAEPEATSLDPEHSDLVSRQPWAQLGALSPIQGLLLGRIGHRTKGSKACGP